MKVALFVEGSTGARDRSGSDAFLQLWQVSLVQTLGIRKVDIVFPISKKHIIAMDTTQPTMSGASEGLDELMARKLKQFDFDVAVVAWDLHPKWEVDTPACRWKETLRLYELLCKSQALPPDWTTWATDKFKELSTRDVPGNRPAPPTLCRFGTFAVCMEPVFEGLLVASESGVRRALGVSGVHVKGWPTGWNAAVQTRPEINLLQRAILAARSLTPKVKDAYAVSGDMRTAKHEWASNLLSKMFQDPTTVNALGQHQIATRLKEVLK